MDGDCGRMDELMAMMVVVGVFLSFLSFLLGQFSDYP